MTEHIGVAVVGGGYWGKNLIRNFHQLGALRCICDSDPSIRTRMASDYPDVPILTEPEDVFGSDAIRAVVISSPASTHYDLARQAMQAGKDVFVEKPLALTSEHGRRLVELAAQLGRVLFVGHILHYHAGVVRLKELINEGRIGRLQYIYSHRLSLGKIRREENILWSFAPHDISLILSIIGEEPLYVDSVGSNFLHARIADVSMTNLKFPSGIGAHILVSWLNPFKEQRLVVVGSRGMFVFDDTLPVDQKLMYYNHMIDWKNGLPVPSKAQGEAIPLSDRWEEPLRAECRAFLEAVETEQEPLTSGEEGLRVLKILEASQESIEANEAALYDKPARPVPSANGFFAHETAVIDEGAEIGRGTKIWHFSHVLSGSRIGEGCNIGQNVVIGPDVTMGRNCKLQNNVSVYKGVTLEDGVFCGPSMVFTNIYNPRAGIRKMDQVRDTLVRKGATLGANCTVVCGATIGHYAFVGAGAVVTKDIADHALVVGNPAGQIGWACECGERLTEGLSCPICKKCYKQAEQGLVESQP